MASGVATERQRKLKAFGAHKQGAGKKIHPETPERRLMVFPGATGK